MMNERYQRHIQLDEIGEAGQQKLSNSRVMIIGAGGLGCPVLQYLAASGVGTIGIVDPDIVSLSNLHRQLLYTPDDIGKYKVDCAQKKLLEINPEIRVNAHPVAIRPENYESLLQDYDVVVDGTDDLAVRYLLSDACLLLNKPLVYGALYKFEGQVSVFNFNDGPTYRCLFPNPPEPGSVPSCNFTGVLGVVPGVIGMHQATETLKILLNLGEILSGKVLCMNLLNHEQHLLKLDRNEEQVRRILELGKPDMEDSSLCLDFQIMSLDDVENNSDVIWVDVRETGETPVIMSPNVIHKPLSSLDFDEITLDTKRMTVFFCQYGQRSLVAVQKAQQYGLENCFSLKEGAVELKHRLKQTT